MSKVSSQKEVRASFQGLPSTEDNFLGISLKSPVIVGPRHPCTHRQHSVHSVDVGCGAEYIYEVWRGRRWRSKKGIEWLGMSLDLIKEIVYVI